MRIVHTLSLIAGLLALLCCVPAGAHHVAPNPWQALAPVVFDHLVPADKAFPGPSVMMLAQDADGFIWIGTQGGLGRWDGYRMRNFFHNQNDPASLPGDFIQTLHVDRQGRLWIGTTTDGVAMYDKQTERFVRYPAGPKGLSSPAVNAIVSDAQGRIWIGTSGGLDYIDTAHGNQIVHVRRAPEAGPAANQIRALLVDGQGDLWLGSNAGLARRAAATGRIDDIALGEGVRDAVLALAGNASNEIVFGTLKSGVGLVTQAAGTPQGRILKLDPVTDAQNAMVLSLSEVLPGRWWAATYGGGIIEFDFSGHSRRIVHRSTIPSSLGINRVAALLRDRSGLVWVAHERGVDIHNPANRTVDTVMDGADLPEISATTFMTDSAGQVWVGLAEQGVDLIAPDGRRTAALRPDPAQPETALPSRLVLAIAEAEPQEAWIGTLLGLYHTSAHGRQVRRVSLPHSDPHPRIGAIVRDGDALWLGTANGLLRFDPKANTLRAFSAGPAGSGGLTDGRITTLLRGAENTLWVATRNGLNRLDTVTGEVEQIMPVAGSPTALSQGFINTMAFDRQGRLWLGTLSAGLAVLQGRTPDGARHFLQLREAAGLPGGRVNGLAADASGRMWASTSDGIFVIDAQTLRGQTLSRPEGLVYPSYYAGAVGHTASGDILFGTSGGFAVVHPQAQALQRWRYQAPLVVSTVRLDRSPVPVAPLLVAGSPGLQIPAGTRSVEVEVAALDYSASQRNRYAFRLDGYDRDWVESDASGRLATYANVAPGRYLLHMRGSNREGEWSPQELTMELHFLPAWYQTWWARTAAGLLAVALAWGLYRWRVRKLRHTQAKLQQQVYLRTLHLERVHAIVKSINEQLDFDALLHTILTESGSIGQVRLATAWVGQCGDGPLTARAVWERVPQGGHASELSRADAQAKLVQAAETVASDMFLSNEGKTLTVRIRIDQQIQGYLVFEQARRFARSEVALFKALKEPFVSAFHKANAISAIQRARADAEASTRAKSDFLANISHEIRTPMNAILGFAGLGTHLDLPPKAREYFGKIGRAGNNLLAIIDDVLDFSKIEAGKLELESLPFAVADVLEQITDLFAWRAAEKGLELLVWSAPQVPTHVLGDPLRLNQILVNLLGNALKFTEHGHIALHVTLEQSGQDGQEVQLRFSVEDTGVGISGEQQARLFQAFSQADTSTTRLYGGTGLGLAISQQLVQAMGGEIVIDSTPGHGSRFSFSLTLRTLAPAVSPRWKLPPGMASQHIVVLDDNPLARCMLQQQLEELGLTASVFASAAEAAEWWQNGHADLLLVDWEMPLTNGIEAARQLRAGAAGAALPVVLLASEFARDSLGDAAERADIRCCVAKPATPAALLAALQDALGYALQAPAAPEASVLRSEAASHIAGAQVLVVDDNVINQQVAREVLLRAGVQVELASNGHDALSLLALGHFDAVLMDIQMPEMDGYEATARIRAQPQHARLPVIAMTAHAVAGFRESSLAMGMNDYVTKPIEPERLFAVLASWIAPHPDPVAARAAAVLAAQGAEAAPAPAPAGAVLAVPGIDVAAALERLGGNHALLAKLLHKFAEEYAPSPARLVAAFEQGALETAAMLVHQVRGAAGNLSMPELHRTAAELEQVLLAERAAPFQEALAAFGAALETVLDGIDALDASAEAYSAPLSP